MEKSGKILENCDNDLANANVPDTIPCICVTFRILHETLSSAIYLAKYCVPFGNSAQTIIRQTTVAVSCIRNLSFKN